MQNDDPESFLVAKNVPDCEEVGSFQQILIHIDLKGAPPKFEFLERLLRFISSNFNHLANGVIIEFEDMFPFSGFLKDISSPNCYT